tara:strand:- start:1357 stop:3189 length:1833 start_codon:yes stop_codon:yes gene_type:complete
MRKFRTNNKPSAFSLKALVFLFFPLFINAQEFNIISQQVTLSQSPMTSDSLILNGSIGNNYREVDSGDTLFLKSGLWNIASGIFSSPPMINASFPDTINRYAKDIYAQAIVYDMNGVQNVELKVQIGGSVDQLTIPMEAIDDSTYRVDLHDSLRSVLNFRAKIVTIDGMFNESNTSFSAPHLQFANDELTMRDSIYSHYPDGIPSGKWRLFSFPGDLDSMYLPPSNLDEGHVFYDWDPINKNWYKPDSMKIGKAYWFKHNYAESVIFSNKDVSGYAVPLEEYVIELNQGANMVGSPFSFPVQAVLSDGVKGPFRYGSEEGEGWEDVDGFEPWAGYAVYSNSDTGTITLKPFTDSIVVNRFLNEGWRLELDVSSDGYIDRIGAIGRKEGALERRDIHDLPSVPSLGNSLRLLMDIESDGTFDHCSDIRSLEEFNGVWNMQIQKNGFQGDVEMTGSIKNPLPANLRFGLIDIMNRRLIQDFPGNGILIKDQDVAIHDLILIAGEESYVNQMIDQIFSDIPEEYSLGQNYPNPFNPTTQMEIALPVTERISLSIYNLLGQKVVTLYTGEMKYGYHTMRWNGMDQFGRPVSSGVYFSELRTKSFRKTKKMLLLK